MEYGNRSILKSKATRLLVILLVLLNSITGKAQTARVDSVKFPIGSKVSLLLEIPFTAGEKIEWPKINDTITKSVEVLSKTGIDTITDEASGEKILRQILSITSFDTGFIPVPPFNFKITSNGSTRVQSTEPLLLEVFKVKVDPAADIKDIKPVMKAPITFAELIPWIIGSILLGLLIFGVLYYLKKRKLKPEEKPLPKVKIPVWEIALRKIEELKKEQLWQKGEVKEYYTRLTDILREYFELRYGVNAAEMTSSEILDVMINHIKDDEAMNYLRNVLFLSDMAKFAKAQPDHYENEQSIIDATQIIYYTRPIPAEPEIKNESKQE